VAEVVVVAVAKAKEGKEDQVAARLQEVAAQSHEEEGCLLYAIHRGADDPARIVVVERWRSRADLDEHLTKPYVATVGQHVELLAESPQTHFLEALPVGDRVKGGL
jgi:quinol monooxygenase YgiN